MAGLEHRGVSKSFDRQPVLHGIDLAVADGEFVVVVGPSGCGKSTLLRLIAGLEDVTEGKIRIGAERVEHLPPARRGIAMVFQSYALYPHMTAFQNIAFGLKLARSGRGEIERRVRETAEMLDIADLLDRRPRELSGGQRQRVAIGRAIVRNPRVFLFDEPLSNLDASLRGQMRAEIARLQDRLGVTTVYVTHDQVEAMTLADRIVVLNDGRIEQTGRPLELYERPATRFVAGFIGVPSMNFIDVAVERGHEGEAVCILPGGQRIAVPPTTDPPPGIARATLGIRPEHVRLSPDGFPARVELVEEMGESHHLHLVLDSGDRLIAKLPGNAGARSGEPIGLRIDPAHCHLFDAEGRVTGRSG